MSNSKQGDTVNKRALIGALVPFALSLLLLAGIYYSFFIKNAGPKAIRFATGITGTATHELIKAIGDQLQINDSDLVVKFIPTSGTKENIKLLESGKVDIAAIPSGSVSRPNLALIAHLYPNTYHLIVHEDSKITSMHELAGKRIAVPPVTSSAYGSFWFLIGQYGLPPETIKAKPMSDFAAFQAIKSRQVDGIFYMRPPANRRTRWIAEAARVRILSIDQAQAMALRRDSLTPVIIPKGVYSGQPPLPTKATPSVAANQNLITRSDFPPEIIRALTAVMFDNRRELVTNSRLASFIQKPDINGKTILPMHPGALSFYDRDQPTFLQENAEPIGVIFSIIAVLVSGSLWLKRRWEEGQKGRIDVYNLELVNITETARTCTTSKELAQQKEHLFDMLTNVVHDLDEDKIDGEGFHFFAFTWEATLSVITTRETELGVVSSTIPSSVKLLKKLKKKSA